MCGLRWGGTVAFVQENGDFSGSVYLSIYLSRDLALEYQLVQNEWKEYSL